MQLMVWKSRVMLKTSMNLLQKGNPDIDKYGPNIGIGINVLFNACTHLNLWFIRSHLKSSTDDLSKTGLVTFLLERGR